MNPKEQPDKEGEQPVKMVEIPKPVGDFILSQSDVHPLQLANGHYYHYADVVNMLKRYAASGGEDKQDELWYAVKDIFFNHLEYNNTPEDAVKELKSKYSIKRNQ